MKRLATVVALLSSVATAAGAGEPGSARPDRPNVLFIVVDDLNDWLGALGGHARAHTPNLDRLLARGVSFTNAHCAAPVCMASRHATLSGLRPSTTGWYANDGALRSSYRRVLGRTVPLPTHFRAAGYRTLAAGKIFHRGVSDVPDYEYWDETRPKQEWSARLLARGHGYGGRRGNHFYPFPRDGGGIHRRFPEVKGGHSLCGGPLDAEDMPAAGMPDEQIAAWAVGKLRELRELREPRETPFLLAAGFVRPHVPYTAPRAFFESYPPDAIGEIPVPADELADIPPYGKAMAFGMLPQGDEWSVRQVGPGYAAELARAYLACVSFVDAQLGKVIAALDASPRADDTIVVLWSDHGQHLGEKRHWRKQCLWEEATRVPLVIAVPGANANGRSCGRPVSLLDLYPTLIDLCGLPPVPGLEGQSLRPLLEDPEREWKRPAITTWHYRNHAVRSERWRYIRYRDGSEELYDHRSDPGEHRNLAGDPRHADVVAEHRAWLPEKDAPPVGQETFRGDALDTRVGRFREKGTPDWLR